MRIISLMHVAFEDAANLGVWAKERGHTVEAVHLYAGQRPPKIEKVDAVFVMGGPMNIYEEAAYPWLAEEKRVPGWAAYRRCAGRKSDPQCAQRNRLVRSDAYRNMFRAAGRDAAGTVLGVPLARRYIFHPAGSVAPGFQSSMPYSGISL